MISRFLPQTGGEAEIPADRQAKVDVRDVFAILAERRLWVAAPTALALLLGVAYLTVAPRVYTGVTSILIDTRTRPAVGDTNTVPNNSPDAVLVESQVRLIAAEPVLRRVVQDEHLSDDPEFIGKGPGLRQRLFAALGLGGKPASADDLATRATLSLAPRITVLRSERTYIADVQVTASDPVKAARLANAVARAYLADQQAARNQSAERDSDWVRDQIATMQASLQDAERKAEAYRRDHGIIGANGKLLNEQDLADAATALAAAQARTSEIKARFDQVQRVVASGRNLEALPDALRSPTMEKLRSQFADISRQQASLRQTLGDRHPALLESAQQLRDVQRLIADEMKRVQAGLANEYQTAQANVAGLQRHLEVLKQTTVLSNDSRVHLDELQRDVDARRAVYDRFLRARDTVREQAVDAPIGRIIAPALVPQAPSSPKTFAVLALSLAGGLTLGIGLALLSDLFLRRPAVRLRGPAAVDVVANTAPIGQPPVVLGPVPAPFEPGQVVEPLGLASRLQKIWPTALDIDPEPPTPAFLQVLRRVEAALPRLETKADHGCRILVTTSVGDLKSRSTVALGLGQVAAEAGARVLVIDADGADGLLHMLAAPRGTPALIDLSGTNRLCYRVLGNYRGSLSIVPVIPGEQRMALRLSTRPETIRIDGIGGHFDVVIFDGPSLESRARLRIIAASAETVVVVASPDTAPAALDDAMAALAGTAPAVVAVRAASLPELVRADVAA